MPDNRQHPLKQTHAEPLDEAAMRAFSYNVRGQVILPHDAIYKEARTVFYGSFDRHPPTSRASSPSHARAGWS
jgi:hypothetical protein